MHSNCGKMSVNTCREALAMPHIPGLQLASLHACRMKKRRSRNARERLQPGGGKSNSKVPKGRGSWQQHRKGDYCKDALGHCFVYNSSKQTWQQR